MRIQKLWYRVYLAQPSIDLLVKKKPVTQIDEKSNISCLWIFFKSFFQYLNIEINTTQKTIGTIFASLIKQI